MTAPAPHLLVTGGSRGIGAATVRLAAARGWAVTFSYRSDAGAAGALVAECGAVRIGAVRADAVSEADTAALFDGAEKARGPVTAVVANAGRVAPTSRIADMDADRLRATVEVNLLGVLLTAREAARRLSLSRGGPGGALVIVSSAASRIGSPFEFVDYAATKGALDTLAIGLAKELGPEGVRVNAVRPGLIDTAIHSDAGVPDRAARLGAGTPLGRAGTAAETAEAILWLAGEASSYVAGALLDVSGGR